MATEQVNAFGRNLVGIREACGWTRAVLIDHLTAGMNRPDRRRVRALVWLAEERHQRRSRLIEPLSQVFGIPAKALANDDLSAETLDSLRERFGFDRGEVVERATKFSL
nr:hypothetical protein HUO10_005177 [Paraburkholderia busanensis]